MTISLPALSLVVLVGPSGSGKSSFARKHFRGTEVLSSDAFRGWVGDNETDQTVTDEAFQALHFVAGKRLELGRLTVIDATNVQPESRKELVALAKRHNVLAAAIVLNLPEAVCRERNATRPDRAFGPHVLRNQIQSLRRSLDGLRREGFRNVWVLNSAAEVDAAAVERVPLWTDKRSLAGPFDIVGDVHGCFDELSELLHALGYEPHAREADDVWGTDSFAHPAGRTAIFLGDLVDRGPKNLTTLRLVRNMVQDGAALCVPGNHDVKFAKKLRGRDVTVNHGLERTMAEVDALQASVKPQFVRQAADWLDGLVSHFVLAGGDLVVAHAGMKAEYQNRSSGRVREFAYYGETTGEIDAFGLPVRLNWAADYRGKAMVVYGHTPTPVPEWLNRTLCIDTGCVFGGSLTALRYPERELVSVPARATYAESKKPLFPAVAAATAQQQSDRLLDAADVLGKRFIRTALRGTVTIREQNATAALEAMSRFAADPRALIYLPPTMSPVESSREPGYLEYPTEAFAYFRARGIDAVICEEKHMGSRAVVTIARDAAAWRERFGIDAGPPGIVVTRTGRRFFPDAAHEAAFLERIRTAAETAGIWDRLNTTWLCLDCELMPWSAKATELLRTQYAATAAAGLPALTAGLEHLTATAALLSGDEQLRAVAVLERLRQRQAGLATFREVYRRYCAPVVGIDGLKLAPFHLLAAEGRVFHTESHAWHLSELRTLAEADPDLIVATPFLVVRLDDPAAEAAAVQWWLDRTAAGSEGMVVKPLDFTVKHNERDLVQPALKVRGRDYLRLIYGPDYAAPADLDRLRKRTVNRKRNLAAAEYALGIEGLTRFAAEEPLRRVHECVFGVLALESEPVDPRL